MTSTIYEAELFSKVGGARSRAMVMVERANGVCHTDCQVSYGLQLPGAKVPPRACVGYNVDRWDGIVRFEDYQNPGIFLYIPLIAKTRIDGIGGRLGDGSDVRKIVKQINEVTGYVQLTHTEDVSFYITFFMPQALLYHGLGPGLDDFVAELLNPEQRA